MIAVLVGLLELDTLAALQLNLSRPLVTSMICGLVLGDPATAVAAGCVIELLWLGRIPVGAVVPPDLCLAGAVAGSGAVVLSRSYPASPEAGTALAILVALPAGWLGGWIEIRVRETILAINHQVEAKVAEGDERALGWGIRKALQTRFLFSLMVTAGLLGLLMPGAVWLFSQLPATTVQGLGWFYWLVLILGLNVILDDLWDRKNLWLAGISLLGFALLIYVLKVQPAAIMPLAALAGLWVYWREPRHAAESEPALGGEE